MIGALCVALMLSVTASERADPAPEQIKKAIKELGHGQKAVREKAQEFLWSAGKAAAPALRAALQSDDPEVAYRAQVVLDRFKAGVLPDTPREIEALLINYWDGDQSAKQQAIQGLIDRGAAGRAALVGIVRGETDATRRRELFSSPSSAIMNAIAEQLAAGQLSDDESLTLGAAVGGSFRTELAKQLVNLGRRGLPSLLRLLAGQDKAYHRDNMLSDVGGWGAVAAGCYEDPDQEPLVRDLLRRGAAESSDRARRDFAAYFLLKGELKTETEALQAGFEKTGDATTGKVLGHLFRAKGELGAAKAVAQRSGDSSLLRTLRFDTCDWRGLAEAYMAPTGRDLESVQYLGWRLALHRLAGNTQEYEDALRDALDWKEGAPDPKSHVWNKTEMLLVDERVEEALEVLTSWRSFPLALELLAKQARFQNAIQLAEEALTDGRCEAPCNLRLHQARILATLGEKERAAEVLSAVAQEQLTGDGKWLQKLIETEREAGLTDRAVAHCAAAIARAEKPHKVVGYLRAAFPKSSDLAKVWYDYFRRKHPDESCADSLGRVREIVDRRIEKAALEELVRQAEAIARTLPEKERAKWLRQLAATCERAELPELTRKLLERLVEDTSDGADLVRLADFHAKREEWALAAERYGMARQRNRADPVSAYLQGWALLKVGKESEGKKLITLAEMLPLANSELRRRLIRALSAHGLEDAEWRNQEIILRTGSEYEWEYSNATRAAACRFFDEEKYLESAPMWQSYVLDVLDTSTSFYEIETYPRMAFYVHESWALGHLKAGKAEDALREARVGLKLRPEEITFQSKIVLGLDKLGRGKEADALFADVFEIYDRVAHNFPRSAWFRGCLAWWAVKCGRMKDQVFEHAQAAAELSPREAWILETLAKLQFERGNREEAIRLIKKCIELKPKDESYLELLKQYQGKVDPPSP